MAILDLVTWPDKRLTEISEEISEVNDETRKLMDDMLETMHHHNGIGLAAVQVGILKRILVMEISGMNDRYPDSDKNKTKPLFLVNPKIIWVDSEEQSYKAIFFAAALRKNRQKNYPVTYPTHCDHIPR